jgi:tRNA pseudouridine55 synthase
MDGLLPIDKPAGMTSHDVVAAVRRALGGVKTGHAGTLDPFATGLLLVLVGRATRIQNRLMELPKRYEVLARLGATSSTGDTEGEIALSGRLPTDPLVLPTGELRQRPPIYSAVKVGGERAYKRARRGERFQMPERIVSVYRFEQLWRAADDDTPPVAVGDHARPAPDDAVSARGAQAPAGPGVPGVTGAQTPPTERAAFLIECSSGTYVRSLIADLHDAYCLELRRTAIGPFDVADALAPPRRGQPWELPAGMPLAVERVLDVVE